MFKIILLGWIGGIALMGIDFPLIMQYEKWARLYCYLPLFFIFINDQCSLIDHFKGSVLLIMYNKSFYGWLPLC